MAATVYTGSGNWSYTNSTGGNVRVIIAYVWNNTTASNYSAGVKQKINGTTIGEATNGTNISFLGFGKHVVYQNTRNSGAMTTKNVAGNTSSRFADEFFLANGQTAALEAVSTSYPILHYNIMVVPEGN